MKDIEEINKSPYMLGYKAYRERKGVRNNPFPYPGDDKDDEGKSDYWQWYAGWSKADMDNFWNS